MNTLDDIGVFLEERKNGLKPLLLLNGHTSRWELRFLQYVSKKKTEWAVRIGVPYGTSLW